MADVDESDADDLAFRATAYHAARGLDELGQGRQTGASLGMAEYYSANSGSDSFGR